MIMSSIAAGLMGAPAGAAGILPPANPASNIAPSSADWLTSIDAARAQEGVGTMSVLESQLDGLPIAEQVFTVVNDERADRGLPPVDYMTSQLDADAQAGADAGTDPPLPSSVTGGAPVTFGGSVWGGQSSPLEADYYWMYDDGSGGASTINLSCTPASPTSCWVHRATSSCTSSATAPRVRRSSPWGPPIRPPVLPRSIAAIVVSSVRAAQ